jgi:formamidopyrimidine-DNA glycosylase
MPELPEVETVRRGLQPALEGARLVRVEARRPDLRFPLPASFAARLEGARVEALERRAKYLLARLDTGETWLTHLGMTGRFTVAAPCGEASAPGAFVHPAGGDPKHEHVVVETDAGVRVAFNDARRFGYMDLLPTARLGESRWLQGLGPEPLSDAFDAAHLLRAFAGRIQNVKATLLDQRVVAGLGNIYVCEALHRARIAPETAAGLLGLPRLRKLVAAIREVLEAAIAAGGSTLRDYRNAEGDLGYFQHSFRAYGREGEPCLTRGCRGTVGRLVQAGRSTFHCPRCQR